MNAIIRLYAAEDRAAVLAALAELQEHERALHETRAPARGATEAYFDRLIAELAAKSGILLIAEAAGDLAGLAAGLIERTETVLETADSTTFGYCTDLYVQPVFRGSGLAGALLDRLEHHLCGQAPITRFRINALAVNRIACRAYERAGFVPYEVMYERLVGHGRS